ncbi:MULTISPECIES: tripartite tricarboxylate transporter permease [Ensifer]|uniref:tripartite tricarboxylate transporter permease n=1 Tax=Ensifer TaxID=106591 RepID=UPI0007126188|nr:MULTISPECIES: tripartite tricarboxylate transporter permease [unclassified Ensifer]KQX43221.1 tripartite tricarboxylate transporter TctA [Ensifer sp. Root1298]KQX72770.1 tripartite tricarboxylate transporter TctA [Ensifer sp. Root1312]KRC15736.1 tripartite tricarboxylate transporter TctA [Ensifer sp. Root74]KRD59011.1 tripartite tricarboxylate transporter TctA [Ensifer sp. Root954]
METFYSLLHGFSVALTPGNLAWSMIGVTLGTAIGVLPGIGPATTVALLMPLTIGLDPISAFIMFAGIYYGAQYGGSTASILLNTPGEAGAMMTALEGNAMARSGRGAQALATAAIGSFVAGTVATIGLTFAAPLLVDVALKLTAPDYFSLMILSLATVTTVLGRSVGLGIGALFFGLFLGAVGLDPQTGQERFTFGIVELLDGIDTVVVAVGLFAVGETLFVASREGGLPDKIHALKGSMWMSREDWARSWKPWLRGTVIGFPIGAIPAGGSELPTILSYTLEKKLSKRPEQFGHGAIEGVAGPEAANNASAAGALSPLLALGLPTSTTAAVLLAAFQQYGLRPGPMLFETNADLVWGLIASLYIGNVLLLVLNLPMVGLWVRLLSIPKPWLYGGILVLASLGTYSLNGNAFDLVLLWIIGIVGFLFRVLEVPIVPCILGLILGPMIEQQMRRSLAISQGDWSVFLTHPASAVMLALTFTILVVPVVARMRARQQATPLANHE